MSEEDVPRVLAAARWYHAHGYACFPVIPARAAADGKDMKVPACKWKQFMKRHPTEEEIEEWWTKYPDNRIGAATGKISNLLVIDCDDEEAHRRMEEEFLPDTARTTMVKSPKGWHYWFKHEDGFTGSVDVGGLDMDIRTEGNYIMLPPSGGLNGKGYEFVKGLEPWSVPPITLPDTLRQFLKNNSSSFKQGGVWGGGVCGVPTIGDSHRESQRSQVVTSLISQGKRDHTLFHIANCLNKGGMTEPEMQYYLGLIAMRCCDSPFPLNEAMDKIKSAIARSYRRERNTMEELRAWIEVTSGHFEVTTYHRESQVVTKEEKHAVIMALNRLCKEGVIERYGNKRGCYRKIEKETEEIKWWEADCKEIPLWLPLDLQEYVKTLPKTITVIAGSQDAGKTALLLNMAYRNASSIPTHYFSSEMDGNELALRLASLDYRDDKILRKIQFRDRSGNFGDVIEPDGLNIIDYFEMSDNFYRIAEEFKNIRDKLNKGIAVIALQKDAKKELGRGASFSMEKPRLYLTVDREPGKGNVLRVRKAKNWRNTELNPNGMASSFWILQGINLKVKQSWEPEC